MTTKDAHGPSVSTLFRADSPAFNKALRQALDDDPTLADQPARAAALASELYEQHNRMVRETPEALLRPSLLQRVVVGFDALTWIHGDPSTGEEVTWGITAVLDLAGLSRRECELLAELYGNFDFFEDRDLVSASFVAFTSKHSETPTPRYQEASQRLARDGAERRIMNSPAGREARLKPGRSYWSRWVDQALVAFG